MKSHCTAAPTQAEREDGPQRGPAPTQDDQTATDLAQALAALKVNTEEILKHKQQLEQLNGWFEVALDNMARGLSMFDSQQRLIVCNRMYREIYGLPADIARPGTPLADIVRFHVRRETGSDDPDAIGKQSKWIEHHVSELARGRTFSYVQELKNGRTILVTNQPLASGGWVDLQEDITEKRRAEQKITWLARHDTLTEIPNRYHFREQLEHALAGAQPHNGLAVHWIDLDNFKGVNDTLGHPVGDALLKSVAARLDKAVRGPDLVARLGGDEFAVMQRNVRSKSDAERLAGRLLRAISEPHNVAGNLLQIDGSIGIALAPEHGQTVDDVLKNVDVALYKAKSRGGKCFAFFEPGEDDEIRERHQIEADLKLALERGQFSLDYQPIVDVSASEVTSFEALLRWHHPQRGLIGPTEFIPIAERTGSIVPIGEWVLQQACTDAAGWPDPVKVSVNLSSVQFDKGNLFSATQQALEGSGLPASRLELEITESVLLKDCAQTRETMHRLQKLGVLIALDDFGTAFASLKYLHAFPFDKIKIDRSFVNDSDRRDCIAIVHAVTKLAAALNMATVAEGIETSAQFTTVTDAGCTEAQGFYFSRPVPSTKVAEVLALCKMKGLVKTAQAPPGDKEARKRALRGT